MDLRVLGASLWRAAVSVAIHGRFLINYRGRLRRSAA
jgi:hypothetical protein